MSKSARLQMIALVLCLVATFSASYMFYQRTVSKASAEFSALVDESEIALMGRMESYRNALIAAASHLRAIDRATGPEWSAYVEGLGIADSLPGILGIGLIVPVPDSARETFLEQARLDGLTEFKIFPETERDESFVINYIAPIAPNRAAQGLDIAFEEGRRNAAITARDTNTAQMTPRILLVQDNTQRPGFLLLVPLFENPSSQTGFKGWVYAPFIGARVLQNMTGSQYRDFEVSIYDGDGRADDTLIYTTLDEGQAMPDAQFVQSSEVELFGRKWFIEWRSRAAFEASAADHLYLAILLGGLSITILLGVLFRQFSMREQSIRRIVASKTEQIQTSEQHLTELERRWDMALRGAQIGVFDMNLRTGGSVVSDTWRELMGVPVGKDIGNPQHYFSDRVHPDDLHILKRADSDCIAGLTDRSIAEFRIRCGRDNKTWRWMRTDAIIADRDATGAATRLLGVQTDINDLQVTRAKLQSSEERFRTVLSNAPVGMALSDETGVFLDVNTALASLLGYDKEELIDTIFTGIVADADLKELLPQIEYVRNDREALYQGELRLVHKEGKVIWGLISMSCMTEPQSGKPIFIAQVQDITEVKAVEQLKSQFVSTVSHELRTPLTSINGSLGLVLGAMGGSIDAPVKRLLEIAKANCDRLTVLVNDILDVERISLGAVEFKSGPHDITRLTKQCIADIGPVSEQSKIEITLDAPDEVRTALVDPVRFHQVMTNLLANAVKFSFEGS